MGGPASNNPSGLLSLGARSLVRSLARARASSVPHESRRSALPFAVWVKISEYWRSFFNGDLARPLTRLSETSFVSLRASRIAYYIEGEKRKGREREKKKER